MPVYDTHFFYWFDNHYPTTKIINGELIRLKILQDQLDLVNKQITTKRREIRKCNLKLIACKEELIRNERQLSVCKIRRLKVPVK